MKKEALKLLGVSADDYVFGGLKDASFCLYKGETVALAGLINSGKITLMRILSGEHPKYSGEIFLQGQMITQDGYPDAVGGTIALLSDARRLFVNMSLLDNLYISQIGRHLWAPVRRNEDSLDVLSLRDALNIDFSKKQIDQLDEFEKLKLEILKSYMGGARIFLFANLTMFLREQEVRLLSDIIRKLNQLGVSVVLECDDYFPILEEVVSRCIVVRNGVVTTTIYKDENDLIDEDRLRHAIVGRAFDRRYETPESNASAAAPVRLTIRRPDGTPFLTAKAGDVIGVYDPREKLPRTIEALIRYTTEKYRLSVGDAPFQPRKIFDLVRQGIAVITKEISDQPIFLNFSPVENACIFARRLFGKPVVFQQNTSEYLYGLVTKKHVILRHCVGLQKAKDCFGLSYEQQYELMIAKWLAFNPKIIVLFTPLNNMDTKNAEYYRNWHNAMRREGKAQILISSSYDSLESICTEILTL